MAANGGLKLGSIPAESVIYDVWEIMRKHDVELADEVLEPAFVFMRSQTDTVRMSITGLGEYLRYREKDVGKAYVMSFILRKLDPILIKSYAACFPP